MIVAAVVFSATLGLRVPAAFGREIHPRWEYPAQTFNRTTEVSREIDRILSVVEKEVGDRARPAKIRKKLFALNGNQIRLLASLADRIQEDPRSAGARIAFLLLSSLIILS